MALATADFSSIEFIHAFGIEFNKHEALWKAQGDDNLHLAKIRLNIAHIAMAKNLGLSLEKVIELCKDFPKICFDLVKQISSRKINKKWSQSDCNGGGKCESGDQMPKWLIDLTVKSNLLKDMKERVQTDADPEIFIRELFSSVEKAIEGNYVKKGTRMRSPYAVRYFARKYKMKVGDIYPVWQSLFRMCIYKLKALLQSSNRNEDIPKALRLSPYEWKITDLAILHNHSLKLVHLTNRLTLHRHSSLILLYKLMVAARKVYDRELNINKHNNRNTNLEANISTDDIVAGILRKSLCHSVNGTKLSGNGVEEAISLNNQNLTEQRSSSINVTSAVSQVNDSTSEVQAHSWEPLDRVTESNWFDNIEGQKVVWALVYTEYMKRGRIGSLVYLQRRWLELLHLARTTILDVWNSPQEINVHPLLPLLVNRFPEIITHHLPCWKQVVDERHVTLETDVEDLIKKFMENEKPLLDVNEDINDAELVKEFYNNELNHIAAESDGNNKENKDFTDILEKIDPTKARMTILFHDSDDDVQEPVIQRNCDVDDNQIGDEEIKLLDSDASNQRAADKTRNINKCVAKENVTANNLKIMRYENMIATSAEEKFSLLREIEMKDKSAPEIDEKLVQVCRVVLTPIEYLSDWRELSRNNTIKCKRFSVKNFTKPVVVDSKELWKCRPYVNNDKSENQINEGVPFQEISKGNENHEVDNYNETEVRIKFEDEEDLLEDLRPNTIADWKLSEFNDMSERMKRNKTKLTRKLKLSRTYYTSNFWKLDRNIELLRKCKPMYVNIRKDPVRTVKKVTLPDISEVRRINSALTTARVSPVTLDAACTNTHGASAESNAINFTSDFVQDNSDDSNFGCGTQRRTNNSLSSCYFSEELKKLLIEKTTLNKKTAGKNSPTPTCDSNIMDSIIENMRLAENDSSTTSLQKLPLFGPFHHNISNNLISSNHSSSLSSNLKSPKPIDSESPKVTMPNPTPNLHNDSITKNGTPVDTKYQCIEETSDDGPKMRLRESILFQSQKVIMPKTDDLKKVVRNLAAKCKILEYQDDGQVVQKYLKSRENRIMKHRSKLTNEIIKITNFLPQFISVVKKCRKRTKKEILKKTEKLTDKTNESSDCSKMIISDDELSLFIDESHKEANDDGEPKLIIDESYNEANNDGEPKFIIDESYKAASDDGEPKLIIDESYKIASNDGEPKLIIDESYKAPSNSGEPKLVIDESCKATSNGDVPKLIIDKSYKAASNSGEPILIIDESYNAASNGDVPKLTIDKSYKAASNSGEPILIIDESYNAASNGGEPKLIRDERYKAPSNDGEPKLIIDQSYKKADKNCRSNKKTHEKDRKNVTENTQIQKGRKKNKKKIKRKRVNESLEEDKPIEDEYQEWQRQKTMSLKYFTLPSGNVIPDGPQKPKTEHVFFSNTKINKNVKKDVSKTTSTTTDTCVDKRHLRDEPDDVILISDSDSDVQIEPERKDIPTQTEINVANKNNLGTNLPSHPFYILVNNGHNNNSTRAQFNPLVLEIHPVTITTTPTRADGPQSTTLNSVHRGPWNAGVERRDRRIKPYTDVKGSSVATVHRSTL